MLLDNLVHFFNDIRAVPLKSSAGIVRHEKSLRVNIIHYENMSVQYEAISKSEKKK